jgi:hypothetical protein
LIRSPTKCDDCGERRLGVVRRGNRERLGHASTVVDIPEIVNHG